MVRILGIQTLDSTPREVTGAPSFSNDGGWLLRFFDSAFFCEWIAVSYLYRHEHGGVRDYLCNRMYALPTHGIENYLFQLCYMSVHKPSPSLEKYLTDMCEKSLRISLKAYWFLQAEGEDLDDEDIFSLQVRCQEAALKMDWSILLCPKPSRDLLSGPGRVLTMFSSASRKLLPLSSSSQQSRQNTSEVPSNLAMSTSEEQNNLVLDESVSPGDTETTLKLLKKLVPGPKFREAVFRKFNRDSDPEAKIIIEDSLEFAKDGENFGDSKLSLTSDSVSEVETKEDSYPPPVADAVLQKEHESSDNFNIQSGLVEDGIEHSNDTMLNLLPEGLHLKEYYRKKYLNNLKTEKSGTIKPETGMLKNVDPVDPALENDLSSKSGEGENDKKETVGVRKRWSSSEESFFKRFFLSKGENALEEHDKEVLVNVLKSVAEIEEVEKEIEKKESFFRKLVSLKLLEYLSSDENKSNDIEMGNEKEEGFFKRIFLREKLDGVNEKSIAIVDGENLSKHESFFKRLLFKEKSEEEDKPSVTESDVSESFFKRFLRGKGEEGEKEQERKNDKEESQTSNDNHDDNECGERTSSVASQNSSREIGLSMMSEASSEGDFEAFSDSESTRLIDLGVGSTLSESKVVRNNSNSVPATESGFFRRIFSTNKQVEVSKVNEPCISTHSHNMGDGLNKADCSEHEDEFEVHVDPVKEVALSKSHDPVNKSNSIDNQSAHGVDTVKASKEDSFFKKFYKIKSNEHDEKASTIGSKSSDIPLPKDSVQPSIDQPSSESERSSPVSVLSSESSFLKKLYRTGTKKGSSGSIPLSVDHSSTLPTVLSGKDDPTPSVNSETQSQVPDESQQTKSDSPVRTQLSPLKIENDDCVKATSPRASSSSRFLKRLFKDKSDVETKPVKDESNSEDSQGNYVPLVDAPKSTSLDETSKQTMPVKNENKLSLIKKPLKDAAKALVGTDKSKSEFPRSISEKCNNSDVILVEEMDAEVNPKSQFQNEESTNPNADSTTISTTATTANAVTNDVRNDVVADSSSQNFSVSKSLSRGLLGAFDIVSGAVSMKVPKQGLSKMSSIFSSSEDKGTNKTEAANESNKDSNSKSDLSSPEVSSTSSISPIPQLLSEIPSNIDYDLCLLNSNTIHPLPIQSKDFSSVVEKSSASTSSNIISSDNSSSKFSSTGKPPLPRNSSFKIRKGCFLATIDFFKALSDISFGLVDVLPMRDRSKALKESLSELNFHLQTISSHSGICFPMGKDLYRIAHVLEEESIILNSRDKVPYMVFLEVIRCDPQNPKKEEPDVTPSYFLGRGIPLANSHAKPSRPPPWALYMWNLKEKNEHELSNAPHLFPYPRPEKYMNLPLPEEKYNVVSVGMTVKKRRIAKNSSSSSLESSGLPSKTNLSQLNESSGVGEDLCKSSNNVLHGKVKDKDDRREEDEMSEVSFSDFSGELDKGESEFDVEEYVSISLTAVPGLTMDDVESMVENEKEKHRRIPSRVAMEQIRAATANGEAPPGLPKGTQSSGSQQENKNSLAGELWQDKKNRIRKTSKFAKSSDWDLKSMIVKSGDDCRQEHLALQLVSQFLDIFTEADLPLWLRPYEVIVLSSRSALIETIPNAMSIHSIKSRNNSISSLRDHFVQKYPEKSAFEKAQKCFVESMAAYSLICYFLQVKDRHNGNIMLDEEGHVIHIDYGFMLSNSPGGVNFETAPFKLTREFLEVMDSDAEGRSSDAFNYFKVLCIQGFLTCRKHSERIILLVEMMQDSGCPCFKAGARVVHNLRKRFHLTLTEEQSVKLVVSLIDSSLDAWRTRQYDYYQRVLNGIL